MKMERRSMLLHINADLCARGGMRSKRAIGFIKMGPTDQFALLGGNLESAELVEKCAPLRPILSHGFDT